MTSSKPRVGAPVEEMSFPVSGGQGSITIGQPKERLDDAFRVPTAGIARAASGS